MLFRSVLLASAFSPDGKRFATGSHNDPVKFWDVTTGEQLFSFPVNSKFASILQFSPDGTRLAVSSGDGTIKLRDLLTGEEAATFKVGGAVSEGDSVSCIVFSPDGKRIAASTSKGVSILDARPWNQETRTEQQALCLVRGALRKCDSEESLRKIIRENVTFTEQAREKALEFAPLFWQSRVKALR